MTEKKQDRSSSQPELLLWDAPVLTVVEVAVATEAFNGGAGDSNTGS